MDDFYHSLFYTLVVAKLKDIVNESGSYISDTGGFGIESMKCFQARPNGGFPHNYLRNQFLETRDVYICFRKPGSWSDNRPLYHILTEKRKTSEVIIYKAGLKKMVGDDEYEVALASLVEILSKFYKVRQRAFSTVAKADFSEDIGGSSHGRISQTR